MKEQIEDYLKTIGLSQNPTSIAKAIGKLPQLPNITKILKELESEGKAKCFNSGSRVTYNSKD